MIKKALKSLSIVFASSGVWDTIAGIMYLFFIGTNRIIDNPELHPFFSIFLGSFFLCFAYLQFMAAVNIKRYAFIIGCLIFGRLFYVILLFYFMFFMKGFPTTFWFTGLIDSSFIVLYILFAVKSKLTLRELFIPTKDI